MKRICKYAHKIQEMWSIPYNQVMPLDDVPPHIVGEEARMRYAGWTKATDIADDDPSNWQCGWLSTLPAVPHPIARTAGANTLKTGDCDVCPCFEPVAVDIPGVNKKRQNAT